MSYYRWTARSTTPSDWRWVSTALELFVDPADIVLPAFVLVGHKNYSTGSDGTYHEATVSEVKYGEIGRASCRERV